MENLEKVCIVFIYGCAGVFLLACSIVLLKGVL